MKLTETYTELALQEFWKQVEVDYMSEEDLDSNLSTLLSASNKLIFEKFGISKSDKVYFICGSARLYLYPKLREAFGLKSSIGDLDMVIPDKRLWEKAGIEGGIYRPSKEYNIEAFDTWEPSRAGGAYADVSVRSDQEILKDSTSVGGYYFMSLNDVMDYKMKMSRDKEMDVVNLFKQYLDSPVRDRVAFLKKMADIIGFEETKGFIKTGKVG
jgi:hypothetical protein